MPKWSSHVTTMITLESMKSNPYWLAVFYCRQSSKIGVIWVVRSWMCFLNYIPQMLVQRHPFNGEYESCILHHLFSTPQKLQHLRDMYLLQRYRGAIVWVHPSIVDSHLPAGAAPALRSHLVDFVPKWHSCFLWMCRHVLFGGVMDQVATLDVHTAPNILFYCHFDNTA